MCWLLEGIIEGENGFHANDHMGSVLPVQNMGGPISVNGHQIQHPPPYY